MKKLGILKAGFVIVVFVLSENWPSTGILVNCSNDWRDLLVTANEREKLKTFKSRVSSKLPEDYMKTDFYLIRWIRARNGNVNAAEAMLNEVMEYRKQNNIKDVLTEDFSDIADDFSANVDGHDKNGRPLVILNMGSWDLRRGIFQGKRQRMVRALDCGFETSINKILDAQKAGKNVTRAFIIADVEGFNVIQHMCPQCLPLLIRMMTGMQFYYPYFWEELVVINAPPAGQLAYDAMIPLMTPQLREILKIFTTNQKEWKSYLAARVDKDQLEEQFGGTKITKD